MTTFKAASNSGACVKGGGGGSARGHHYPPAIHTPTHDWLMAIEEAGPSSQAIVLKNKSTVKTKTLIFRCDKQELLSDQTDWANTNKT